MRYELGGIFGRTGELIEVEIPGAPGPAAHPAEGASPAPVPAGGKRLRVSAWMDHPATAYGRWIDVKTGKFKEDLSMIQAARGSLDDITFLSGIWMSKTKGVTWKVDSVPRFLQKSIDVCHQNGIQVFLGYSITDEGGMIGGRSKLFRDWIHSGGADGPSLQQHAQDICNFVFIENGFDVDGIAFDLELNGLKAEDADNFGIFYGALADLLAEKGKFLSVATGVGNVKNEASWLGTFRAQPFRLAKGRKNFIIRPMAYDNFILSDAEFDQWHKDIIDYALDTVQLEPDQFQLGLKISKNVHSQDASWLPPKGWTERKCTFDAAGIADRCRTLLRPNGVGLITFAGWGDFAGANAALNPANPPAAAEEKPAPAQVQAAQPAPAPAQAPADAILRHDDPRLSDGRKKLLAEVDKRMGSVEGKPAAPGKTNLFDGTVHQRVGTTCGLLPGTVMKKVGVKGPIAACGTEGVRIEGKKLGVWVENDGTTLPKPGDIYVLRYPDTPGTDSVAHVGIIWDVSVRDPALGELWITADSGQGSKEVQEAHLVNREMKKVDGAHFFLSGPKNTPGDSPLQRRIGGWVDLDKLLAA